MRKQFIKVFGTLIATAVAGAVMSLFSFAAYLIAPEWTQSVWYAMKYDTVRESVYVSAKPRDCDFLTAPLGLKNCHYEREIEVDKWQPDPNKMYFRSDLPSNAFDSIPGHQVVDTHTKVYIIWNKETPTTSTLDRRTVCPVPCERQTC